MEEPITSPVRVGPFRGEPYPPSPRPTGATGPLRSRRWLHLLLFICTALTATVAGSLIWEGALAEIAAGSVTFGPGVLLRGLPYAFWLLAILGAHEMGHYLACRYHRIDATLPFFIPGVPPLGTFGALIRIRSAIPDRRALFDVAAAGPIAGFAVALPVLVAGLVQARPSAESPGAGDMLLGSPLLADLLGRALHGTADLNVRSLYGAGWVGMLVTSMNLFPVGQLDGGHAAYAVARSLHRVLSRLTLVALAALVIWQTWSERAPSVYTVWFVVLLFLRDRHPRLADEEPPLGTGRKIVAVVLAVLFVLSFIPLPIRLVGP